MHLVDILIDKNLIAHAEYPLSLRAHLENRVAQPKVVGFVWPRANAEKKTAEIQDIQSPITYADFQAPEPLRSGVLAFAPPLQEVIH